MKFRIAAIGLCGSLLGACSAGGGDDHPGVAEAPAGQQSEDIVRGQIEKKLPQVVAVRINGFNGSTLCSGTYFDNRMVVTAAHCIRVDAIPGQTFVYFGKDYLTDRDSLPDIPAPGQRSKWARVEKTVVHPDYDSSVHYVDLAVLFLDRELPFEPIRLNRQRVGSSTKSGTIAGWGGSKALVPDISQVEGSGIERSASVRLLGSPTAADYHADDPNAGILDPAIRANLLKTDGRSPRANTCAGDSGGPLFTEDHGRDELSAVNFWTGLSCEDYAMFTRVQPFLGFFDAESKLNGDADIVPRVDCVEEGPGGALTARFGYRNDNQLSVSIPYGFRNWLPQDRSGARPTTFVPGDDFSAFKLPLGRNRNVTWQLGSGHGPVKSAVASAASPRCDTDSLPILCADRCDAQLAAECSPAGLSRVDCMSNCQGEASLFEDVGCSAEWHAYLRCNTALAPAADNWDCSIPGFPAVPASPHCDDELNTAFICAGF